MRLLTTLRKLNYCQVRTLDSKDIIYIITVLYLYITLKFDRFIGHWRLFTLIYIISAWKRTICTIYVFSDDESVANL